MTIPNVSRQVPAASVARPQAAAAPKPASAPTSAPVTPGQLPGLQPDAYASLAKSYTQNGNQDLANQYTLAAVNAAKSGGDAFAYATQRYGPGSNPSDSNQWNQYWRSKAPYVANADTQLQGAKLAAGKFKSFDEAIYALRSSPAQTAAANDVIIQRAVDLAPDQERLQYVMPLIKDLGSPAEVAKAQAAIKTKPPVNWFVRLWRGLQESQF